MQNINFDDGYKEFSINNDEKRVIRFNPSDFSVITRAEDAEKVLESLAGRMKNSKDNEVTDILRDSEKTIKEQFDYIFNSNVADIIFNGQSPVALVKGEFLFMRALRSIMNVITKEVEKEKNAAEKRMSKYTEQYK